MDFEVVSGATQFKLRMPEAIWHFLGSLHCEGSKVQSAIRLRPINAAIRLNPQSAFPSMRNCFR
eukprot:2249505-Alexandrium_andersonii.AAC.1